MLVEYLIICFCFILVDYLIMSFSFMLVYYLMRNNCLEVALWLILPLIVLLLWVGLLLQILMMLLYDSFTLTLALMLCRMHFEPANVGCVCL